MADVKTAEEVTTADAKDSRVEHGRRAGWLCPMAVQPKRQKVRERSTHRRASNKGCLPMTLLDYLQLVEWTGRQLHSGKRGRIKSGIPGLLDRLGTTADIWLEVVKKFERRQQVKLAAEGDQFAVGVCVAVTQVT